MSEYWEEFQANSVNNIAANSDELARSVTALLGVARETETPTLRDQFAMAALTGLLANGHYNENSLTVIRESFGYANGMLKVRAE